MKRVEFLLSVVCMTTVSFGGLSGESSADELQSLHREIGSKLIKIKKENPQAQPLVYSVLDQLGRYHSVSKNVLAKKHTYKSLFKTEQKSNEFLKKQITEMEEKIDKMKKAIVEASDKLKKDFATVNELKQQKETLAKEKERFEIEKQELISERDALIRERDELLQGKESGEKVATARRKARVLAAA